MSRVLREPNFIRYFAGDTAAKIADNFFFVYLTWLALQETGSPAYAGALLMVNAVPRLIFMIFGGSLADSVSPEVILRTGNIAQSLGLASVLVMLAFDSLSLPALFVVAGLFGLVDAFSNPASMSAIPRLLPDNALLRANSLLQGTEMATFMAGSLIAGAVLQIGSMEFATAFNLSLYIVATVLFFTVKVRFQPEEAPRGRELRRIIDGLRYAWARPPIRANIAFAAVTNIAVTGPASIGFLLLVTETLDLPPIYYSIVMTAFAGGALLGAMLAGLRSGFRAPGHWLVASYLTLGLGFIVISLAGNVWAITATALVLGIVVGVSGAVNATWVQLSTGRHMLGRISALMVLASLAFDPFSQAFAGLLSEWSIPGMFAVAGLFLIVATVALVPLNRTIFRDQTL